MCEKRTRDLLATLLISLFQESFAYLQTFLKTFTSELPLVCSPVSLLDYEEYASPVLLFNWCVFCILAIQTKRSARNGVASRYTLREKKLLRKPLFLATEWVIEEGRTRV